MGPETTLDAMAKRNIHAPALVIQVHIQLLIMVE
jgi:hypothetical protein